MSFNKGGSLADKLRARQGQRTGETPVASAAEQTEVKQELKPAPTASSILKEQHDAARVDQSVQLIDLDLIDVEEQVRKDFDISYIEDLAVDFALSESKQPNQPVTVWRRADGRFLLDDGENRLRGMRHARAHRAELGVSDATAFTFIRATVRGKEPEKLDRIQSQAKANLLRDNLNPVEIGRAAQMYLEAHPDATQTDIAKWLGFQKMSSGRVQVANAMKLVSKVDGDLVTQVEKGEISIKSAFKIQDLREAESRNPSSEDQSNGEGTGTSPSKSEKAQQKAASKTKATTLSLPMDSLRLAAAIIVHQAKKSGVPIEADNLGNLDRKALIKIFDAETLSAVQDKLD